MVLILLTPGGGWSYPSQNRLLHDHDWRGSGERLINPLRRHLPFILMPVSYMDAIPPNQTVESQSTINGPSHKCAVCPYKNNLFQVQIMGVSLCTYVHCKKIMNGLYLCRYFQKNRISIIYTSFMVWSMKTWNFQYKSLHCVRYWYK